VIFRDRKKAGEFLGKRLVEEGITDCLLFGISRGGVVVAASAAKVAGCPFYAIVARKLRVISNDELAFGAIADNGVEVLDYDLIRILGISPSDINRIEAYERSKLIEQVQEFSPNFTELDISKKTAVVVDDGIATGNTAKAALRFIRTLKPKELILASPVCATDTEQSLKSEADKIVCLLAPENFMAVGQFYHEFEQVNDQDVVELLVNGV
jgi:putative phosphoribosyl transferase